MDGLQLSPDDDHSTPQTVPDRATVPGVTTSRG